MKNLFLVVLVTFLVVSGCKKVRIEANVPDCIKNKIEVFAKNKCENISVKEYIFQNKTVYLFDQSECCCDIQSEVTDTACITLGYLGGIAGITEINGESFENAVLVKTVWEKK